MESLEETDEVERLSAFAAAFQEVVHISGVFSPLLQKIKVWGVYLGVWYSTSIGTHFEYCTTIHMIVLLSVHNLDSLHDDISEIRGTCREVHHSSNRNKVNGKHRITRAVGTGPAATRTMFSQLTHAKMSYKDYPILAPRLH